MTKYLQKGGFSSPANNQAYEDNYDKVFGKKCEHGNCTATFMGGSEYLVECDDCGKEI